MNLRFTKMHGAGNDFVVIDGVRNAIRLNEEQIRKIADRNTGIGCDQVLLIEPPTRPDADFEYRIFNADGSPAGQCGNGARCVGRFIHEQRLSSRSSITLQVGSDLRLLEINEAGSVKAELGAPVFEPAKVPFLADQDMAEHALALTNVTVMAGVVSMAYALVARWNLTQANNTLPPKRFFIFWPRTQTSSTNTPKHWASLA